MVKAFNKVLDECVDCINRGERLEDCLASYPEHAKELEPLLRAMHDAQMAYTFTPSPMAKMAGRQRFNAALEALERRREARQPILPWLLGWSRVGVTVAAVLVIALIGYFGLRPVLFPGETMPEPGPSSVVLSPEPNPTGNFVFLISDDVNAIGDFQSVNVTISKIGLQLGGESGQLVEFDPEVESVDLTLLLGDKAQQIWRGDVPEGEYTNVSIQVSNVRGILKETGQEVEIKLPSQKLHISKRFQVSADKLTTFTYDLTVVAAGSPQSGIKYILKPQVDQSGADHKPIEPKGKAK